MKTQGTDYLKYIFLFMILLSPYHPEIKPQSAEKDDFNYFVEQFDDIRILKYKLPSFEDFTLEQKKYIYYLSQAALAGRDILWDQNFRFNLLIRKTIEGIISGYDGDQKSPEYQSFLKYAKKVFFANGIHHHYSGDKFVPGFSEDFFSNLIKRTDKEHLPLIKDQTPQELADMLAPVLFDEKLFSKKVVQTTGADMVAGSATNFYKDLTQKEVEDFYAQKIDTTDPRPVSTGLNSRLIKVNGEITEEVYKSGGKYGSAIDSIVKWLTIARECAGNEMTKNELSLLIEFYRTGDLRTWDEYNVAWVKNTNQIDYTNGFIETYDDPLGMKATWEAIVNYTDPEATKRTQIITQNAQWFEDNAPIHPEYRKEKVTGIAAKVINIAMLGGACYPASPLGINLPNADWIRKEVGSKSVTLANITNAYDKANEGTGFVEEFTADEVEVKRYKMYHSTADALHTDLHECVGHASGKLCEGTDPNALRNYASPLEEARADLFALYFMMDNKITDLGLLPGLEAAKAAYDHYLKNGLMTQLVRIRPGKEIEQAHMRARSMISHWVYEKGKPGNVVEFISREGKTYVRVNDYQKLQELFGQLLKEIQRIKSEGDFPAGRDLIENYGVKVDPKLHAEVLTRYEKLNLAPYTGFVNPYLFPVYGSDGEISDVVVEYTDDYLGQMMYYGKNYSTLPVEE